MADSFNNAEEAKNSFYAIECSKDGEMLIDEIYTAFDNRTCNNCEFYNKHWLECNKNIKQITKDNPDGIVFGSFGCNKFVKKI